jgi:PDZ domain-containing secreted protein
MEEPTLNRYTAYIKLTVFGESIEDAIYYATQAIDTSDLLDQDGVIAIELIDDADSIELLDDDSDDLDLIS